MPSLNRDKARLLYTHERKVPMAYNPRNLSVLAYANGFTLWHYVTPDSMFAVKGENYFASAADMLRKGDMILVNSTEDNDVGILIVQMNGPEKVLVYSLLSSH